MLFQDDESPVRDLGAAMSQSGNAHCPLIEIFPDGRILANDGYLALLEFDRAAAGELHYAAIAPKEIGRFDAFWSGVDAGELHCGAFRRVTRSGRTLWLHSSFAPVRDAFGDLIKIVEVAIDVTEAKTEQVELSGQVAAIDKSHCVITFAIDGTVLSANQAYLDALGYTFDEIDGRHHRMFVDPSFAHGPEYARFWRELERGQFQNGEYRCVAKGNQPVWLQATYSPIFDLDGKPTKIVKYATVVTEERLRQAEHQGQIAAIHKAQAVISFGLDGTIIDANDNFLDIMGYRLSDVRGKHHRLFVDDETAKSREYSDFWQQLSRGHYQSGEFRRIGKDGQEVWLQATYNPIFDMTGRPFRVIKYASNVTDEKLRQLSYRGQIEAIHRSQGVVAFDLSGVIVEANQNFLDMVGYSWPEVVGHHHSMFVEQSYAGTQEYADFWQSLRAGTYMSAMYKRIGKGGREVWIRATYNPILDLHGEPIKVIKFATDVTSDVELAEAFQDAKRQAQHDSATALPNRVRLASFMSATLATPSSKLAVLYLDLDRFKPVNDMLGHHVGDRVLGEVADRLRRHLHADQLAARIGGDEFVIAAPDIDEEAAIRLAQDLIAAIGAPILIDNEVISIGISVGVAMAPADGKTPDELLRCADTALYRAKSNGGSTYAFHSAEMNERMIAYRTLVEDMKLGLDRGEFFLEYQPRFNAVNRTINSVEALVRWQHPTRGRIAPMDFIPVAEKSGLIVALGEWVLRTACRAAKEWDGIGVSVNVSPVQFRNGGVTEMVLSALADVGLEPERLELEVTEGVLVEDAERARGILVELKAAGVRLAIDDFGTGYSSLSYLRSFPFDVIKIDRQFISDIENRDGGRAIVQAIVALGKALGLSVTAEGVETDGQLMLLMVDQCTEVQGYLLARPLARERIDELLIRLKTEDILELKQAG